jgi:hypothetical protein
MDEVRNRAADDATSTDAEQALSCGVQVSYCERVVENDDRRRETLQDAAGVRRPTRAARAAERIERAG